MDGLKSFDDLMADNSGLQDTNINTMGTQDNNISLKPFSDLEESTLKPFSEIMNNDTHLATRDALDSGVEPKSLAYARQHMNDQEYIGWCQKFSVDAAGGTRAPTAQNAWETAPKKK